MKRTSACWGLPAMLLAAIFTISVFLAVAAALPQTGLGENHCPVMPDLSADATSP
ncbi:MAG TPA: hypothetical protein VMD29_04355 [Terracidiphilus sp.]|nr:hypothetical protein [Terracidiphilus sp.]